MRDLGDVLADLSSDAEEAHLYSTLAPVYDFVYERHFDYDRQYEIVAEAMADLSSDADDGDSVLEVGPGTGHLLAELEARYETAVGLERSEAMAERARTRTDDASVVIGDATSTELDETFDAVVMLGRVTGHFLEDGEAERAVENCLAHLRPGGVLLFDYFPTERMEDGYEKVETFESEDYRVTKANASGISDADPGLMEVEFEYEITDRRTGERATASETMTLQMFTHDEVRELLADAGFADVSIRPEAADGWPLAVARRPERND